MGDNRLAVVHHESTIGKLICDYARTIGYVGESHTAGNSTTADQVLDFLREVNPTLLFLGESWGQGHPRRGEGVKALTSILESHPDLPIVMVSGGPSYKDSAIASGAREYWITPDLASLKIILNKYFMKNPQS